MLGDLMRLAKQFEEGQRQLNTRLDQIIELLQALLAAYPVPESVGLLPQPDGRHRSNLKPVG